MSPPPHPYELRTPTFPWGDYGRILVSGMTGHRPRTENGLLQLARTAPFVPPITLQAGNLLVTDDFRIEIDRSPLVGLGFRPVVRAHIARLDWRHWDQNAVEPAKYPESGEPEGYMLDSPHDPLLAEQIGPIWEVVVPEVAESTESDLVRYSHSTWTIYLNERAKQWLEQHAGDWLSFRRLTPHELNTRRH